MNRKTLDRCGGMWLLTVTVSASCVLCGALDWCAALVGGVFAGLLYYIYTASPMQTPPKAVQALQVLWLAVPLSVCATGAAALFPDAAYPLYVPAVVLALGWLLAERPRDGILACCVALGFFVLAAVGVVTVFAAPDVRWQWLMPTFGWEPLAIAVSIGSAGMLLGAACPEARPGKGWQAAVFLSPAVLCAVAVGCLSRELSAREALAFYTLSRSISLFGVLERFEALIAACLSMGLCAAAALVFRAARAICGRFAKPACALLFLGALALWSRPLPTLAATLGTCLLWVAIPVIFSYKRGKKG